MRVYFKANIAKVGAFGFTNGINLLLSGNTINFWLSSYGIDPKIIGLFACIALPYALKYFIALFINHCHLKKPQYKTWLITSRMMLTIFLLIMSRLHPQENLALIALSGFFIALFSVIQDVILSSNRIKILNSSEQVQGSAIHSGGFHLGMLISGAGVIFLSAQTNWSNIFISLALLYLLLTIFIFYLYKEPEDFNAKDMLENTKFTWRNIIIKPFEGFMSFKHLLWVLVFTLVYRLSDNMMMVMVNPLFLDIGFNAEEIASIYKFFGAIMVILGGLASGLIIPYFGIKRSLLIFSIAHLFGTLIYLALSIVGKSFTLLYATAIYDAITGGMVMTAYITFITSLCKGKYVASQYALLSSVMGFSRVVFPTTSGIIVESYGFTGFFMVISLISFCAVLFTAYVLKKEYI